MQLKGRFGLLPLAEAGGGAVAIAVAVHRGKKSQARLLHRRSCEIRLGTAIAFAAL